MAESKPPRRLRASDADRDAVLSALQEGYVSGRLDAEELGERQEAALRSRYVDELGPLLDDLPEGQTTASLAPASRGAVAPRQPAGPLSAHDAGTWTASVMGGRSVELPRGRRGLRNFAWWGGDDIYVRDAMGPGAEVILELHAVMGGHDIYVPPGVRVIDESVPIMAGNDIADDANGDGSNGTLILRGVLFWAGSDVHLDDRD